MVRMKVLDPTAPPPEIGADPGPAAGLLAGKLVGLRYDRTWRSFEWVIDEWTTMLADAGAEVRPWCAGNRIGEEGELTRAQLERFVDEIDVAVVGLGN